MEKKEPRLSHAQKVNTIFLLIYRYKGDYITMSQDANISELALKKWRVKYEIEAQEIMEKSGYVVQTLDEVMKEGLQRIFETIKTCPHPDKIAQAMMRLKDMEPYLPIGRNADGETIESFYIKTMKKLAEGNEAERFRV